MKRLKRMLGLLWMLLGPLSVVFLFMQAYEKVGLAAEGAERTNTALQWGIILFIFLPISAGLVIFGRYAMAGEYDERSENTDAEL